LKRKIFSILFALVLVTGLGWVVALPVAADGTTYYVATTGDDSNDGSLASPWLTIQHAVDTAAEGDTIIVGDGTYNESITVTTAGLTLRSENGMGSTIIENAGGVTAPEAAQCGFLIRGSAHNFTLGGVADQGFTFSGGTSPRLIQLNNSPAGVQISYNTIDSRGTANTGINVGAAGAASLTLSNNVFIADEDATYQDWPLIGPDTANPVLDVTVTNNMFTGSGTPDKYGAAICLGVVGVDSLAASTFSGNTISAFDRGIIVSAGSADLDITGNTISNCGKGVLFRSDTHADMTTNTFTGNTYDVYHAAEILTGGSSFYGDIQDAIDAAGASDTIKVYPGTYTEDLAINTTSLALISDAGKDDTTIQLVDGVGIDIQAGADNLTLGGASGQGFAILGGDSTTFNIQLTNAPSDVTISYNSVDTTGNASQGISVGAAGASGLTVSNNEFTAEAGDLSIWCPDVVDLAVSDNTFTGPGSTTSGVAVEPAGITGTSTISGNTISGYGTGIWILSGGPAGGTTAASGLTISDNTISGSAKGITLGHASVTSDMTTISVTQNTLTDNTVGVYVSAGDHVLAGNFVINYNDISGSTTYGLENANATDVNARYNYWGDPSGPTIATNARGAGDAVSVHVLYEPWLHTTQATVYPSGIRYYAYNWCNLTKGWNIWSTPAALDTQGDTWGEYKALGTDLDLTDIADGPNTYYFNGSTQAWAQVTDSYTLTPCDAIYVKVASDQEAPVLLSHSTSAPSKTVYDGWNLVSSSYIDDMDAPNIANGQDPEDALASIYYVGGVNSIGYSQVVSPATGQTGWSGVRGQNIDSDVGGAHTMLSCKGYWVYMTNAGTLAGTVFTPVSPLLPLP